MKLRMLVTGSRTWPKPWIVQTFLDKALGIVLSQKHDMTLIHGHCRIGVDAVADDWAIDVGCEFVRVPALWHAFGKTAGFVRNEFMVDALKPHMAVAFIHNKSRGATHCAEYATKKGVDTFTIQIDD
jgi:hypothetical protein